MFFGAHIIQSAFQLIGVFALSPTHGSGVLPFRPEGIRKYLLSEPDGLQGRGAYEVSGNSETVISRNPLAASLNKNGLAYLKKEIYKPDFLTIFPWSSGLSLLFDFVNLMRFGSSLPYLILTEDYYTTFCRLCQAPKELFWLKIAKNIQVNSLYFFRFF